MAFVFSGEGPAEELGAAEQPAETPEAMEMPAVLWHEARCTGAEDLVRTTEGFEDSGREGIAEELGLETTEGEALGLCAGFFDMAFLGLTEASAAAAAAESSLNFLTTSLACLAYLAWRLAHSLG